MFRSYALKGVGLIRDRSGIYAWIHTDIAVLSSFVCTLFSFSAAYLWFPLYSAKVLEMADSYGLWTPFFRKADGKGEATGNLMGT